MHRSKKNIYRFILAGSIAILLCACGSMQEKREQRFYDTLTLFKHALRWEAPESQETFFIRPQTANLPSRYGMRALDMDMLTPAEQIDERSRMVRVRLHYLNEKTQSILTVVDKQQWRWMGQDDGWRRHNPMPQIQAAQP